MSSRMVAISLGVLLMVAVLVSGCSMKPQKPEGTLSVPELLEEPEYGIRVQVYGQVSQLGELRCPCFALTSDKETLFVWYDLMIDEDEVQRPSVNVEGIANGDWVVVAGELRSWEASATEAEFWAAGIEVME